MEQVRRLVSHRGGRIAASAVGAGLLALAIR